MEGPPLGPGGEDITWPDQVSPRGRKASSTRKIKPQTSNLYLQSRSRMCQMMPSNQRRTKNEPSHTQKRRIARGFTYAVLCCAVIRYKHVTQPVRGSTIFYLHSLSQMCQMMPSNQRSTKNKSLHPQERPIARLFTYAISSRAVISHCCGAQCLRSGHSSCVRNA